MGFAEYYRSEFLEDLARLLATAPVPNHLSVERNEIVLQPRILSRNNRTVRLWSPSKRAHFGVALFFTVLIDQVCYTYFRDQYERFRSLTLYPKFRGDCPGGCHYNLHPSLILACLGGPPGPLSYGIPPVYGAVMEEALPVMRYEIKDFCRHQLPGLNEVAVWERCVDEVPRVDGDPLRGTLP